MHSMCMTCLYYEKKTLEYVNNKMKENNWIEIYRAGMIYQVEIVQAILSDNSITSVIVNKQDSSYHFGEIELHVHQDDAMIALKIINTEKL